jgi:hypothetical protein
MRGSKIPDVHPMADGRRVKRCPRCQITKAVECFAKSRYHLSGFKSYCKECNREWSRKWEKAQPKDGAHHQKKIKRAAVWYAENGEYARKRISEYALVKKYGITVDQRDRMVEEQDGKCLICSAVFDEKNKPNVDHCHATGVVRGILCNQCNKGLGCFRDDTESMSKAISYLRGARP